MICRSFLVVKGLVVICAISQFIPIDALTVLGQFIQAFQLADAFALKWTDALAIVHLPVRFRCR